METTNHTVDSEDKEVIEIVHNPGEDKPWEIKYDDIGLLKRARAAINYPVQHFETEEKALEVAEMIRDIIKADAVYVEPTGETFDDTQKAEFFHSLPTENDTPKEDEGKFGAVNETVPSGVNSSTFTGQETLNEEDVHYIPDHEETMNTPIHPPKPV